MKNEKRLCELGFEITLHDKMPDVVLYREDKDWLYFIESVTSVGPMDDKRIIELQELTKNVKSGKILLRHSLTSRPSRNSRSLLHGIRKCG